VSIPYLAVRAAVNGILAELHGGVTDLSLVHITDQHRHRTDFGLRCHCNAGDTREPAIHGACSGKRFLNAKVVLNMA
jgi:hypothetical protein